MTQGPETIAPGLSKYRPTAHDTDKTKKYINQIKSNQELTSDSWAVGLYGLRSSE